MKHYVYLLLCLLSFFPILAQAKSYQLSLFYDKVTGEIRLDKFAPEPVQIAETNDSITFEERMNLPIDNNFQVILEAYQYTFPETLIYPYAEGAFVINVPYFPHVKSIQIKSNTGKILAIDVSKDSTCNQNNLCEYEKGEDAVSCLADCVGDNVTYSEETLKTLQANNGVIRDEQGTVLLSNIQPEPTPAEGIVNNTTANSFILIAGIVFLILGIGLFFWKYLKK